MFVDVALPLYLENLYTYSVPKEFQSKLREGLRIIVPLGRSKVYTGVIIKIHNEEPKTYKVKPIIDLLEETPSITPIQIKHWKWISDYYMCSFGEVLNVALPSGLKIENDTKIEINEKNEPSNLDIETQDLYDFLKIKENISLSKILEGRGKKSIYLIKFLLEKGFINVYEDIYQKFKPKLDKYILLNKKITQNILDDITPKQKEVLLKILSIKKEKIKYKDILKLNKNYSSHIKKLHELGIIEIIEKEISRFESSSNPLKINKLSNHQYTAYKEIKNSFKSKDITLLYGVTSSGKTEIYIKLIQDLLKQKKQVLYLLPEIALTTQIIKRLKKVFGDEVGIYHSKYNFNERTEVWNNILKNKYKVVVGARSSVFLPFKDLGFIIIDEEHDQSFKQREPNPRYNAKSSAIILAKMFNAKVLLGSATPSLESFYFAEKKEYGLVKLTKRFEDIKLPEINLVDTKEYYKKKKMKGHFSPELLKEIESALINRNQIILFQNRRGYSPYLECRDCGNIIKCKNCDVSLTYHKGQNILRCHYCGFQKIIPENCEACGNISIEDKGFGTEKIENEILELFPNIKVQRMDIDTTSRKNSYQEIIQKFEDREVDILVGTQMVTKGLSFDNVSLVGVLNADNLLFYPDFRAYERGFQTLTQVSGRAGRKNKQGKVIIQTSNSENEILTQVKNYSYKEMYNKQIMERQQFSYPPFVRIIEITLKHRDLNLLNMAMDSLSENLKIIFENNLLGPIFPVVNRVKNLYIKKLTIKLSKNDNIKNLKNQIKFSKENFLKNKNYRSIKFIIDVDVL